ncbi:U26-like protein [Lissonota sp. PSUC_FEM 10030012]|nr:U26-like protein [Lissonota sp. PSUC_FEM 10030012]
MNWIMMNVTTDALRRVGVRSNEGKSGNIDGNRLTVGIIDEEQRKLFVKYCKESIPALEIDYNAISKFPVANDIFNFRLVQRHERMELLNIYVDKMPCELYELLVARPVYTFTTIVGNPIVKAFVDITAKSGVYTLEDLLRIVGIGNDNENVSDDIPRTLDKSTLMLVTATMLTNVTKKSLSS